MKYKLLRGKLREKFLTGEDVAKMLGRSISYVRLRIEGKRAWDLSDVHTLMRELDLPIEQMHIYFPPNGESSDNSYILETLPSELSELVAAYEHMPEMQPAVNALLGIAAKKPQKHNYRARNVYRY